MTFFGSTVSTLPEPSGALVVVVFPESFELLGSSSFEQPLVMATSNTATARERPTVLRDGFGRYLSIELFSRSKAGPGDEPAGRATGTIVGAAQPGYPRISNRSK